MDIGQFPDQIDKATFRGATATVKKVLVGADGVLDCYGTVVPADASVGYAPGCLFRDIGTPGLYINTGTAASSAFKAVTHA